MDVKGINYSTEQIPTKNIGLFVSNSKYTQIYTILLTHYQEPNNY